MKPVLRHFDSQYQYGSYYNQGVVVMVYSDRLTLVEDSGRLTLGLSPLRAEPVIYIKVNYQK